MAEPTTPFQVQLRPISRRQTQGDYGTNQGSSASLAPAEYHSPTGSTHEIRLQSLRETVVKERLVAYCEDLAEWFTVLFHMEITAESFGHDIEDGVLLLRLARFIEVGDKDKKTRGFASHGAGKRPCPPAPMDYTEKPTTAFHKRDNVSRFIAWVRQLGVDEAVIFEADDLVGHKNEKNVLYSLMEMARVQGGVEPPRLIQLERLMDSGQLKLGSEAEERSAIARIKDCLRAMEYPDERVERTAPGRYEVADFGELNIAILRNHVLVRLQNSWDTLQHYIMTHGNRPKKAPSATPAPRSSLSATTPMTRTVTSAATTTTTTTTSRSLDFSNVHAPSAPAQAPPPARAEPPGPSADELAALRKLLEEKERRIAQLERNAQDSAALERERAQLQAQQRDLQARIAQLEGQLTLFQNANKDQEEMIQHIAQVEDDLAGRTRDLDDRNRQIEDLLQKLDDAERELEDTEQRHIDDRVKDAGEAAVRYKRLEDDSNKKIQDLEARLRDLNSDEKDRDEELQELRDAMARALASHATTAQEREDLAGQVADLNDEIERLRARIRELEEENAILRRTIDDLGRQIEAERALRRELEAKLDDAMQQLADLQAERDRELDEIRREMQRIQVEGAERARGLEFQLRDIQASAEEAARAAQETKSRDLDITRGIEHDLTDATERLRDAEAKNAGLDAALADAHKADAAKQARIGELEAKMAKTAEAAARAAQEKQDEAARHRDAERALEEKLAKAKRDAEEAARRQANALEDLEKVNEALRAQLTQSAADQTRQSHDALARAADLDQRVRELERKLADEQARARAAQEEAEAQQRARDAQYEGRLKDARDQQQQTQAALEQARKSLADAEAELARLRREREALQQQLKDANDRLAGDVDRSKRDLAAAVAAQRDANDRAAQLEKELEAARQAAQQAERSLAGVKGKLLDTEGQRDAAQRQAQDAASEARRVGDQLHAEQRHVAELEEMLAQLRARGTADARALGESAAKIGDLERQLRDAQDESVNKGDRAARDQQALAALQQRLREAEQQARDRDASQQRALQQLQDRARAAEEAAQQAANDAAARAKAEADRRSRDARALQEALDRAADLERELAAAQAAAARAAGLEQKMRSLQERADRPAVNVEPAVINANVDEVDLLSEPQLQQLAQYDGNVADALAARDRSRAALAAAEAKVAAAARAADTAGPASNASRDLALAQADREREGQVAANDENIVMQEAKRALEKLRHAHLRSAGKLDDARTAGLPRLGLASTDAVLRIAELEDLLSADSQEAARQREENDALRRKMEELERSAAPAERDDLRLYRENIANWLNALLGTNLTERNLMETLEDGRVLCAAANVIDDAEQQAREADGANGEHADGLDPGHPARTRPITHVSCDNTAPRGSDAAKRNVGAFIEWARGLGITAPDIFTPPDLVERKDDWAVLVGLFDLARCTRGVSLPALVAMERAQALAKTSIPAAVKNDPIDQVVNQVMSENPNFRVKRVAPGRYVFGQKVLLMRILHGTVMVRVGGGWEELRSYLVKHAGRQQRVPQAVSEAEAAVEAIRQSAGGVGLHTTRTRVRGAFE